jgi:hypothetical protein
MGAMKSWAAVAAFLLAAFAAALSPLLQRGNDTALAAGRDFPGWPTLYEGHKLTQLPLTQREDAFVRDFPGRVGRFSDGRREIIIRWVAAPTRLLHPAADCFRGSGYSIVPMPVRRDTAGAAMSCFRASHQADRMQICEVIGNARGESWPDVSAWYWNALFGSGSGPWWSFVVAEKE